MSYLFDGAADKLEITSNLPIADYPFSVSIWFNPTAIGVADVLFTLGVDTSAQDFFKLQIQSSTNLIRIISNDGTISNAQTTEPVVAGVWQHVLAVCNSSASDDMFNYYQGRYWKTATGKNPVGMDVIRFGEAADGSGDYAGKLAKVALWNHRLESVDAVKLAAGIDAREIGRPVAYYPLESNANDYVGNNHLTVVGATLDKDNPAMTYRKPPRFALTDKPDIAIARLKLP